MYSDEKVKELIIKGRRHYSRTLLSIRRSSMVEELKGYCNHIILDVNEERAINTFKSMENFEKIEFTMLLSELFE